MKNLSINVSNELLKEAFEQYFGAVERAIISVDDRGKSIGEGIVEFEKKPSAQKCLNDCTERCFFITRYFYFYRLKYFFFCLLKGLETNYC